MSATADCITEGVTEHGYWWRYSPAPDEPHETMVMAIRIAIDAAADEARKTGRTYVVASSPHPVPAVYVFAGDHPDAGKICINIMYELLPDGACLRCHPMHH